MDEQTANQIYDILRDTCGASEFWREAFVHAQLKTGGCSEFRFQGALGFGGKLYDDGPNHLPGHPRFRVRYYPEDRTPEREEMCRRADELLAAFA